MVEFKLTINDVKQGKSYSKEVKDVEADAFKGGKIGDNVAGDGFGFTGYEFEITGGSDNAGFPMRKDLPGMARKKIYALSGEGINAKRRGARIRKSVRGNTLSHVISQINLKVIKYGSKSVKDIIGVEDKPKEEAKPEEKPKEEKPKDGGKEETKEKGKEEASPEEKPKDDKAA